MYEIAQGLKLEQYQSDGIKQAYSKLKKVRSLIIVSPMRSGKTVIAVNIAKDFLNKSDKKILILVHRQELLEQMRLTFFEWLGFIPEKIDADTVYFDSKARVLVAMVETINNRLEDISFVRALGEVGMIIGDEAHLSNFRKVYSNFGESIRIGFTATPISAKKSEPLKEYWGDIVILCQNSDLISLNEINPKRGVVPCYDFDFGIVDRASLKMKGQDFDEEALGVEFGKVEQIQNTINAIIEVGYNKKWVIYNANIEHSLKMHEALLKQGFNSRHLDSDKKGKYSSDSYRKDTLGNWINNTPNAILNNVGIATIGTNIPSLEGGIFNYSTTSVTKYWQCVGRPATPYQYPDGTYKTHFLWIDTGCNIGKGHKRFHEPMDWEKAFRYPKSPVNGVSPVKTCPDCKSLNYASATVCAGKRIDWITKNIVDCGFLFSITEEPKIEDPVERKLKKIGDEINVSEIIVFFKDRKEFYSYWELFHIIANNTRAEFEELEPEELKSIFELSYKKATEWFKLRGRKKYKNFRIDIESRMLDNLIKVGFKININDYEYIKTNDKPELEEGLT